MTGGLHAARHCLGDHEYALEVGVEHTVPFGLVEVERPRRAGDAGIVDEDVEAPCIRQRSRHRGAVGHVDLDGAGASACRLDG